MEVEYDIYEINDDKRIFMGQVKLGEGRVYILLF